MRVIFRRAVQTTAFVVVIANGALWRDRLESSKPIANEGDAGLWGIAIADDFNASGIACFYHDHRGDDGLPHRFIAARFDDSKWPETRVLRAPCVGASALHWRAGRHRAGASLYYDRPDRKGTRPPP